MEAFYFQNDGFRLFGVFHRPPGPAEVGMVFCEPYGQEMVNGYARFARWAKELGQKGIAVLRFHYRGTGESDGDSSEFNLEGACRDAEMAVARLRELLGSKQIGLFGYRLGAIVAAQVAGKVHANLLLLWSPVVNLSKYMHEILRMRLTTELIHQGRERVKITRRELAQQLEAGQAIDVVGYQLSPTLYHQLMTANPWAIPPVGAQVLWLGRSQEGTPGIESVRQWQQAKVDVDYRAVPDIVFWEEFPPDLPARFAQESLTWLRERLAPTASLGVP